MSASLRLACIALAGVAVVTLAGCHRERVLSACHDSASYQEARSVEPLKYPPGYETSANANAMKIPQLNTPEPPSRGPKQGCLDDPPRFVIPKAAPAPQA